ncbi:hypothetical protein DRP77_00935, partial [Candidatus Poribacteria bacterium]
MADRSLEQRLRRLGAGWKAVLIFRGLLMWAGLSGLSCGAALLFTSIPLPIAVKLAIAALAAGVSLWSLWRWLIKPSLSDTSPLNVAKRVERAYPESDAVVVTAYQLGQGDEARKLGYSPLFLEMVRRRGEE